MKVNAYNYCTTKAQYTCKTVEDIKYLLIYRRIRIEEIFLYIVETQNMVKIFIMEETHFVFFAPPTLTHTFCDLI